MVALTGVSRVEAERLEVLGAGAVQIWRRTALVVSPGAKLSVPLAGDVVVDRGGVGRAVGGGEVDRHRVLAGGVEADHHVDVAVVLADDHVGHRDARLGHRRRRRWRR